MQTRFELKNENLDLHPRAIRYSEESPFLANFASASGPILILLLLMVCAQCRARELPEGEYKTIEASLGL